jgi:glycosyltransferase involved in cell wall biosynthesis
MHGVSTLHCHQYTPFVYGALARLKRPMLRLVYTEHGRLSDAGPSTKRRVANAVLRTLPHAVTAVSADLRSHMATEGFRSESVEVVTNGIVIPPEPTSQERTAARAALGLSASEFAIGSVGRLDSVKNFDAIIDASRLLELGGDPATFVIFGEGPERDALTSRTRALGLERSVRFMGHRADVGRLLPAFDVYLNTSIFEGVSLTILEAMAARLPVIATNVGGTPEVVAESTGVLVPARAPAAVSEAILRLRRNKELREQLGAAGRVRVCRQFDTEQMVSRYVDIYRNLGGIECAALRDSTRSLVS